LEYSHYAVPISEVFRLEEKALNLAGIIVSFLAANRTGVYA
jgi:hypothetical protein